MKKSISRILAAAMCMTLGLAVTGCGSSSSSSNTTTAAGNDSAAAGSEASGNKEIKKLTVAFVPSREPQDIITATEPLKGLLQTELAKEGYDVKDVDISVGTSFEAVGEALSAGTTDIGFIPGGTYVLYDDGCEAIVTATRDGLSVDSDDPKVWNESEPITGTDKQVTFYRALIVAGPSEKGKELAAKVNAGEELTWEDLDSANWSVMGSSSSAGYIYPSLWMLEKYGKNITDLSHAVQSDSYGSAFARLASGQVDVMCTYADARRDYEAKWNDEYAMSNSVWEDTDLIGVTPAIYNDTISVSKTSPIMDDDFKTALTNAFINIGNTEEGKQVISIYTHQGYQKANDSDYDSERAAQEMIKKLNGAS